MATSAKEESEIASIKEQAELIKQDLNVKDKAGEARLTRGNLVNSITEELGGIRDSYTSIVNDGRYVVKGVSDRKEEEMQLYYISTEKLQILTEGKSGDVLINGENGRKVDALVCGNTVIVNGKIICRKLTKKNVGFPTYFFVFSTYDIIYLCQQKEVRIQMICDNLDNLLKEVIRLNIKPNYARYR